VLAIPHIFSYGKAKEFLMTIQLDVYSDVICPWCYLGKARLEKALAAYPKASQVEVHYFPYELNPSTPEEGYDRKEYLERKYGAAIKSADERLKNFGLEMGVEFNFEKAHRIPNTLLAHRLLWLADQKGIGSQADKGLHKAYFTEGVDIGKPEDLARVALQWGWDEKETLAFLRSEKGTEEVRALEEKAYNLGITGVPFFVFNNKLAVSGAQAVETFLEVLEKVEKEPA
jgi:predicted DsbA family dithiol-disulfide isomerase